MTLKDFLISVGFDVDEASINRVQSRVDAFAQRLGRIGNQLALCISAPIAAASVFALKASADVEQAAVAFEVFIGNTDKAKAVMSDLVDFAVKTPFRFKGLNETANMLLAMGESSDTLIQTLRVLGDVSRGRQDLLNRVALAYGQIMTAGKLRGTELRQLTEAGVSILPELAKLTGYSESKLSNEVGRLGISASIVRQALVNMTKEGGKYFQLLEKQALTLSGVWSNLLDATYFFSAKWGDQIVELFNIKGLLVALTESLTKIIEKFDKLDSSQKKLLIGTTLLVMALGPLAIALSTIMKMGSFIVSTFSMMSSAILGLQAGLGAFMLRIIVLPGLVMAALASIILLIDEINIWMKGGESYLGDYFGSFSNYEAGLDSFINKLKDRYEVVKTDLLALKGFIDKEFLMPIKDLFKGTSDYIWGIFDNDIERASKGFDKIVPAIWKIFSATINGIVYGAIEIWDKLVIFLTDSSVAFMKWLIDALVNVIATAGFSIWDKLFNRKLGKQPGTNSASSGTGFNFKKLIEDFINFDISMSPTGIKYTPGNFKFKDSEKSSVKVNNTIKYELPPGTTEQQIEAIRKSTQQIVQDKLDYEIRKVYYDSLGLRVVE